MWFVDTPGSWAPVSGQCSWPQSRPSHWKHHCRPHPAPTTNPLSSDSPHATQLHPASFMACLPHQGHALTTSLMGFALI